MTTENKKMTSHETTLPAPMSDHENITAQDIRTMGTRLYASKLGHIASLETWDGAHLKRRTPETVFSPLKMRYFGTVALSEFKPAVDEQFAVPIDKS